MRIPPLPSRLRRHVEDPLYRDAWFLMANSVLGAATGFAFWLVAARAAPPAEVGAAAVLVSGFTLAALLGKLGLDAVLVRHAPTLTPASGRRLLTRALLLAVAASAAFGVAVLAVAPALAPARLTGALAFVAFAVAIGAGWVLDAWFVATRRASRSFARNGVFNAARLALVAVPAVAASASGIATAWGAAAALSLGVAIVLPRRSAASASAALPRVARTAASNAVVGTAEFLPALVLPLVVASTLGTETNAVFYVAWTLAGVPFLASKAIAQSTFAELAGGEAGTALARGGRLHLLALGPAILFGVVLGPAVLALFGSHYVAGAPLLVVLLVALVPAAANNLALAALKATDRRRALVAMALGILGLTLAGTLVLLPILGILAPGVAWLAANVVALPWTLALVLRTEGRWSSHGLGLRRRALP